MARKEWSDVKLGGFGGFDCSCSRASFQGNHQYHAYRRRFFLWKPKWPWVKTKPPSRKATPAIDNCIGRLQRKVLVERGARFRCAIRCLHRKGAPDGKPTPNAETWESRSALATRHERQPCRLFPRQANQRRHRETDRGDGTRSRIRRDGEALGVPTEIIEQRATTMSLEPAYWSDSGSAWGLPSRSTHARVECPSASSTASR